MYLSNERLLATQLVNRWQHRLFANKGTTSKANIKSAATHVIGAYTQEGRYHHRLFHLAEIRNELGLDNVFQPHFEFADPLGVELAIDVHDVVQGLTPESDVADSERWIVTLLRAWGLDPEKDFPSLLPCIRATEHNTERPPENPDAMLVADADLAVLGQQRSLYDEYAIRIKREFGWVPTALFAAERIKVLEGFLQRPAIYHTEHFRSKYEQPARDNLAREIKTLGQRT